MIDRDGSVLVTGANGMVGRAMVRVLEENGFSNILKPQRAELNLLDRDQVFDYFSTQKPEYVFIFGSKVGGIGANMEDPCGFLIENLHMELNVMEASFKFKTKKNIFTGSSCIYPRECLQPIKEEYLLSGPLEKTNEGYALAKIVGLKIAEYLYKQHDVKIISAMPCNIYGDNDHFDLEKAHVLSSLIRRMIDACDEKKDSVTLWGTGSAKREFIHVRDVAAGLLMLMDEYDSPDIINLGTGLEISIKELAELIQLKTGFGGQINWDTSKPDGTPRKCMDVSKIQELGFVPEINLEKGIEMLVDEYKARKVEGSLT